MQAVAGKTVEELPLIDWEESSMNCGGDVRDDAFLVDLLICFCTEGVPRLQKLLGAALAYRLGQQTWALPGDPPRAIETIIKEEAHALKGSAANVRLWRLAKACEDAELPCKALVQSGGPAERKVVLDQFCVHPRREIQDIVHQFRSFVAFIEDLSPQGMRAQVEEGLDLEGSLGQPSMDTLAQECTVAYLDKNIAELWSKFENVGAVSEAAPVAAPAETEVEPTPEAATVPEPAPAVVVTNPIPEQALAEKTNESVEAPAIAVAPVAAAPALQPLSGSAGSLTSTTGQTVAPKVSPAAVMPYVGNADPVPAVQNTAPAAQLSTQPQVPKAQDWPPPAQVPAERVPEAAAATCCVVM